MTTAEFQLHVAQNVQWAIHEARRLRGELKTPTPDPETLWNIVAADTRRFFLLQAEVAIGICAERWGGAAVTAEAGRRPVTSRAARSYPQGDCVSAGRYSGYAGDRRVAAPRFTCLPGRRAGRCLSALGSSGLPAPPAVTPQDTGQALALLISRSAFPAARRERHMPHARSLMQ